MQLFITLVFENFISQRCQFGAKTITPAQLDLIEFEDRLIFDTGESTVLVVRRNAGRHARRLEAARRELVA